jgi:hypothetical protein
MLELAEALPRTLPWSQNPHIPDIDWDKVGRDVRDLGKAIAKTITALCVGQLMGSSLATGLLGKAPEMTCNGSYGPVLFPGNDTPESTGHDVQALGGNPAWMHLTHDVYRYPSGWYSKPIYGDPCGAAKRALGQSASAGQDCDEFPFRSTREGGPGLPYWTDPGNPMKVGASIQPIKGNDNSRQGGIVGAFYAACSIPTGGSSAGFTVIPIPLLPKTMWTGKGANSVQLG